jgi:hypothetical protein
MNDTQGNIEIAVAIGRIEEMLKTMDSKLDKLETVTERHWKKLAEHDVEIELLKQRQGPRIHITVWIALAASIIGLVVAIADRIYVNQGGL